MPTPKSLDVMLQARILAPYGSKAWHDRDNPVVVSHIATEDGYLITPALAFRIEKGKDSEVIPYEEAAKRFGIRIEGVDTAEFVDMEDS